MGLVLSVGIRTRSTRLRCLIPSASLFLAALLDPSASSATERPKTVLTYIAGIEDNARPAASEYFKSVRLNGKWCFMSCRILEDAADRTIIYTTFWAPLLHKDLEARLGPGSVVLEPLILKFDGMSLYVEPGAEAELGAPRLFFAYYLDPWLGSVPYTAGRPWGFARRLPDSNRITVQELYSGITKKSLRGGSKIEPDVRSQIYTMPASRVTARSSSLGKITDQALQALSQAMNPAGATPDVRYAALLGEPSLAPEVAGQLLDAEWTFRRKISDTHFSFISDTEYASSIRQVIAGEEQGAKTANAALMSMFVGNLATMGVSGAATPSLSMANLRGVQQMNSTTAVQQSATAPVIQTQVNVSTGTGGGLSTIGATSVADLRQKFRALIRRKR